MPKAYCFRKKKAVALTLSHASSRQPESSRCWWQTVLTDGYCESRQRAGRSEETAEGSEAWGRGGRSQNRVEDEIRAGTDLVPLTPKVHTKNASSGRPRCTRTRTHSGKSPLKIRVWLGVHSEWWPGTGHMVHVAVVEKLREGEGHGPCSPGACSLPWRRGSIHPGHNPVWKGQPQRVLRECNGTQATGFGATGTSEGEWGQEDKDVQSG